MIFYVVNFFKSKDKEIIDALLKNLSKAFKMNYQGGVNYYLVMNVRKDTNGTITTSQPVIIDKILNSLGICYESKMHDKLENVILTKYEDVNGRKQGCH